MQCLWKHQYVLFVILLVFSFIVYFYNEVVVSYWTSRGHILALNSFQSLSKSVDLHSPTSIFVKFNYSNSTHSYYSDNFKVYSDMINGSVVSSGGHEKLIVIHGELYRLKKWLPDNFTKDDIFYRLSDGGYSCPRKCVFTHSIKYTKSADAVLFSVLDSLYRPETPIMPKNRPKNQIWLGQTSEASASHYHNVENSPLNVIFNWTVTYRSDSDIYLPYGYLEKINKTLEPDPSIYPASDNDKTNFASKKLAVALISNCHTNSRREDLIQEMQKFIPVQMYGGCGQPCPNVTDCRQFLAQEFKFLLAFENSLCEDYVTEKFFHSLQYDIVPVVFGLANYTRIGPPNSYINVMNFPSIKDLASHLQMLGNNEGKYNKYFEWKKHFKIQLDPQRYFCRICVKLWEDNFRKEYLSFSKWWSSKWSSDENFDDENFKGFTPAFRKILKERKTECIEGATILKELGVSRYILN